MFESIFDLSTRYQWHLDDRPTGNQNEINPDVLGYIFEQFINQKQMGAYYTKEDVTHFMTSSTLLPSFLERFEQARASTRGTALGRTRTGTSGMGCSYGATTSFPTCGRGGTAAGPRPAWASVGTRGLGLAG